MTWHIDDDDRDEIASTFADLGGFSGVYYERQCEHVERVEDRSAYLRECREQRLPEAVRWRENEKRARKESREHHTKDAVRKAIPRRRKQREEAWTPAVVEAKRGQLAVEWKRTG
jgi:hypothetical protein